MLEILVIDCGSRKVPEIVAMVARAGARPRRWPLAAADVRPAADAMVISGGRASSPPSRRSPTLSPSSTR